MLIRFDPFREFDRLTEQLASTAARVPRGSRWTPTAAANQFIVDSTSRASSPNRSI
jgi:hypothetical protein